MWRMVWQEQTEVIVMLAQVMEGNPPRMKCEHYWPAKSGLAVKYGAVTVKAKKPKATGPMIATELLVTGPPLCVSPLATNPAPRLHAAERRRARLGLLPLSNHGFARALCHAAQYYCCAQWRRSSPPFRPCKARSSVGAPPSAPATTSPAHDATLPPLRFARFRRLR
jgi:hypothetical protein